MHKSQSVSEIFSGALNERTAFLEGYSTRRNTTPESCKGFAKIKVDEDQVYYHWQIFPEAQQDIFPISQIPDGESAFSFTLNRIVEEIENFQVVGEKPYQVNHWAWQLPNLDKERVQQLIAQLELVRKRIRMYLGDPSEIDSFLAGWGVAAKAGYNFSCDSKILDEILADLEVPYTLRGNDSPEATWDFVDKRLRAEALAWQQTYQISA